METSPQHQTDEELYDRRLEALVDAGGYSYDSARELLGIPPYEIIDTEHNVPAATEPIRRRLGNTASETFRYPRDSRGPFGEEEGVGYPNGRPLYERPMSEAVLPPEQAELNSAYIEYIKFQLDDKKRQRENK